MFINTVIPNAQTSASRVMGYVFGLSGATHGRMPSWGGSTSRIGGGLSTRENQRSVIMAPARYVHQPGTDSKIKMVFHTDLSHYAGIALLGLVKYIHRNGVPWWGHGTLSVLAIGGLSA